MQKIIERIETELGKVAADAAKYVRENPTRYAVVKSTYFIKVLSDILTMLKSDLNPSLVCPKCKAFDRIENSASDPKKHHCFHCDHYWEES